MGQVQWTDASNLLGSGIIVITMITRNDQWLIMIILTSTIVITSNNNDIKMKVDLQYILKNGWKRHKFARKKRLMINFHWKSRFLGVLGFVCCCFRNHLLLACLLCVWSLIYVFLKHVLVDNHHVDDNSWTYGKVKIGTQRKIWSPKNCIFFCSLPLL